VRRGADKIVLPSHLSNELMTQVWTPPTCIPGEQLIAFVSAARRPASLACGDALCDCVCLLHQST
jgi:hypothetical protein